MIIVNVTRSGEDYRDFTCDGHADYAEAGSDIICAAVSVLVVNTFNSIETFTEDAFESEDSEGHVEAHFSGENSPGTRLLMNSMLLGLKQIETNYKKKYLQVKIREV